jgi:hypothetical protein
MSSNMTTYFNANKHDQTQAIDDFLRQGNLSYIVRAHEAHSEGVALSKGAKVGGTYTLLNMYCNACNCRCMCAICTATALRYCRYSYDECARSQVCMQQECIL